MYPEAQMIPPMLINHIPANKEYLLPKICEEGQYFAQLKKDGYFYQFERTEHYNYLFSRTISRVTGLLAEKSANVPHIINALENLPANTTLVGEIYYPNQKSKNVTTIMGSSPEKAIFRQNNDYGLIHYYIHDIIRYDGCDLKNVGADIRYKILKKIFYLHKLNQYDFLELAVSEYDNIYNKIQLALDSGEEGMVLKKKDGVYTPGKRPAWITLKIKQIDYLDVIITGVCEPTMEYTGKELEGWEYWFNPVSQLKYPIGRYYNEYITEEKKQFYIPVTKPFYYDWFTAIKIGAYDKNGKIKKIGTISSGLTDEMRKNLKNYIGQVCSIKCMEIDCKNQSIRHGAFIDIRKDKPKQDCTLESIFS